MEGKLCKPFTDIKSLQFSRCKYLSACSVAIFFKYKDLNFGHLVMDRFFREGRPSKPSTDTNSLQSSRCNQSSACSVAITSIGKVLIISPIFVMLEKRGHRFNLAIGHSTLDYLLCLDIVVLKTGANVIHSLHNTSE